MHSSGMRTASLLTISQHAMDRGGCVSQHALGRGVYPNMHWAGGVCPGGVADTPPGPEADTPPLWTDRHM